ncbi:MAG: flagellar hook-length control protein FliK [Plesiomonas sp.]
MPQSVLLPAAGPTASSTGPASQTPSQASGTSRPATSSSRFDECLNQAQQSSERQKDAAGKTANTAKSDAHSAAVTHDKGANPSKSDKADKSDKAASAKNKKDPTVDPNAETTGAGAANPSDVVDDSASSVDGDGLSSKVSEAVANGVGQEGAVQQSIENSTAKQVAASSAANAADDPWLQQIEASRQTLQSGQGKASTGTDALTQLAATGGRTQAQSVELAASAKLNANAEHMAAALKDAGTQKVEATAGSAPHTDSALQALLDTDAPSEKVAGKADSELLAASKAAATHQAPESSTASTHTPSATHQFLDSLRQAQGNNVLSAQRQPEPQAPTPLPLRHPEQSAQALQEQVQFLLNRKLDTVEIRLDPPELGNLQIKLHLNQDQAQVGIVVQSSHARELLEQTLPRLREMLAQQGIQLGQTQVQQQSQQQQGGASGHGQDLRGAAGQAGSALGNGGDIGADEMLSVQQHTVTGSAHAVDYYA